MQPEPYAQPPRRPRRRPTPPPEEERGRSMSPDAESRHRPAPFREEDRGRSMPPVDENRARHAPSPKNERSSSPKPRRRWRGFSVVRWLLTLLGAGVVFVALARYVVVPLLVELPRWLGGAP